MNTKRQKELTKLNEKLTNLEVKFIISSDNITDKRLDKYIMLKTRIKELSLYGEMFDQKDFIIENFIYLIRSFEIYLSMFENKNGYRYKYRLIKNFLGNIQELMKEFQEKA